MSLRYYVVPKAGDGASVPFHPKYVYEEAEIAVSDIKTWRWMDYGLEDMFLVAMDLETARHNAVAAETDVVAVPSPLSTTVTAGARTVAINKLEAVNIPADWITTSMTWQQVLARVVRLVQLMQRFHGLFGRLFAGGLTLDSTISQIPAGQRNRLATAANSMGADTSGITGATTLRAALVLAADQLFSGGLNFGGTEF